MVNIVGLDITELDKLLCALTEMNLTLACLEELLQRMGKEINELPACAAVAFNSVHEQCDNGHDEPHHHR